MQNFTRLIKETDYKYSQVDVWNLNFNMFLAE